MKNNFSWKFEEVANHLVFSVVAVTSQEMRDKEGLDCKSYFFWKLAVIRRIPSQTKREWYFENAVLLII